MSAEFKGCRCEDGELKEVRVPALGVCAALRGQQLKRFGELHHLKEKEDVTDALGTVHNKGVVGGGWTCTRMASLRTQVKVEKTSKQQCCGIMSALNALLLLLSNTLVGVDSMNCAAVLSSL